MHVFILDIAAIFESKPHQQHLILHILSRESAKPLFASITRFFAKKHRKSDEKFTLNVTELNTILEGGVFFRPNILHLTRAQLTQDSHLRI
jgi:hypothetical protein